MASRRSANFRRGRNADHAHRRRCLLETSIPSARGNDLHDERDREDADRRTGMQGGHFS
jgi:hypothetical protein